MVDPTIDTPDDASSPPNAPVPELSRLMLRLLRGVLYREDDEALWGSLLRLQARVREQAAVLLLELQLDDAEGYAFLRSTPESAEPTTGPRVPRLVTRRPLSYPVSLLLVLLRKRLAEFDAGGGDTRLVLAREDITELLRVFLADGPNEAKLIDQIEGMIAKVVDLGFLAPLKSDASGTRGRAQYEVRRILKAFVDAQWIADFDARLEAYRTGRHAPPSDDDHGVDAYHG